MRGKLSHKSITYFSRYPKGKLNPFWFKSFMGMRDELMTATQWYCDNLPSFQSYFHVISNNSSLSSGVLRMDIISTVGLLLGV